MKKPIDYLKDGVMVITRDGCKHLKVGNKLLSLDDGFLKISGEYTDDLISMECGFPHGEFARFDIMKIYNIPLLQLEGVLSDEHINDDNLIWERIETCDKCGSKLN